MFGNDRGGYLLARPMPAVQAQIILRKPWGSLPKAALCSAAEGNERYASQSADGAIIVYLDLPPAAPRIECPCPRTMHHRVTVQKIHIERPRAVPAIGSVCACH